MKRRSLLTLLPATATLLAMRSHGAPVPQTALTRAGFTIAVQCWSFRKFSLFQSIEMASSAGAGAVEIFPGQLLGGPHGDLKVSPDLPESAIASLLQHLQAHQVSAVNFGVTDIPKDPAAARNIFTFAQRLGLYGMTTESIEAIDTLESLAAETGIMVAFHNHPKRPAYRMWNPDDVFDAVRDRHPNLGLCADIGHWASSGLDPLEVIRKVAPRVRSFHLKDRASIQEWTHDRPFGSGIIPIPAILDEVRKHGFAGNVSIEYEHNWDQSLPEIAQCAGFLRGYAATRS